MSVSTAIGSSRRSEAHPSRLHQGSFQERGEQQDNSQQPPALFRRPIVAVAVRPSAVAQAGSRMGAPVGVADSDRGGRGRSEVRPVGAPSRNRNAGQRGSRAEGESWPNVRSVPPVPQAARDLLSDASRGLGHAMEATTVADRYAAAHLAALRAAAAVLAARAKPVRGRRGSAWELISKVAPEFAEWAAFFAAGSAKRQAAEAGIHRLVSPREADDMVRQVAAFLDLVEDALTNGPGPGPRRVDRQNQPQRRVL